MNKRQWYECKTPWTLASHIKGASDRKFLLFGVAVCRHTDSHKSADLLVMYDHLEAAAEGKRVEFPQESREWANSVLADPQTWVFVLLHDYAPSNDWLTAWYEVLPDPTPICDMLRDIFGCPMHTTPFKQIWRSDDVQRIAQKIYETQYYTQMPILADALEEAGCSESRILDHCRNGQQHWKGCWVIDGVLEKE